MNHVEERLFLLHFWIWERHSILLIMPCCWTSSSIGYLQYWNSMGSPRWSCPANKVQLLLLWLGTCFRRNSQRKFPGTPLIFDLCEWYAFTNTEWVTSAVCWWHLSDLLWWWPHTGLRTFWAVIAWFIFLG